MVIVSSRKIFMDLLSDEDKYKKLEKVIQSLNNSDWDLSMLEFNKFDEEKRENEKWDLFKNEEGKEEFITVESVVQE